MEALRWFGGSIVGSLYEWSGGWTTWVIAVTWQLAALAAVAWVCEKVFRVPQPRARYA